MTTPDESSISKKPGILGFSDATSVAAIDTVAASVLPETLAVSSLKSAHDNQPRALSIAWEDLARRLTAHKPRVDKDGPAWCPCAFLPGTTRSKANVDSVSLLVLDFDKGDDPAPFTDRWREMGLAFAVHSSHSSQPDFPKWRAAFPLAAPVPGSDWERQYRRMASVIGDGATDPVCKDASRLYFLPSMNRARHHSRILRSMDALSRPTSFPS